MSRFRGRRPSAALLVAIIGLVAALSGPALAQDAVGVASRLISGKNIKKRSISGIRLRNDTLTGQQINEAKLGIVPSAASATNAQSAVSAVNAQNAQSAVSATSAGSAQTAASADQLAGHVRFFKRVTAVDGASFNAAKAASAEVVLAAIGSITLYGRCFRDTSGPTVHAQAYVKTTVDGGLLDSAGNTLSGSVAVNDTLDIATNEDIRRLINAQALANVAQFSGKADSDFSVLSGDGTALVGTVAAGAKQGSPPAGDTQYGPGNACIFSGFLEKTS